MKIILRLNERWYSGVGGGAARRQRGVKGDRKRNKKSG